MGYQFLYEFICERTGRRHHVGVDSRITMDCKEMVRWKGYCKCGERIEVVKERENTIVRHLGQPPENLVYLHSRRTQENKVLAFKTEGNVFKPVSLEEARGDSNGGD